MEKSSSIKKTVLLLDSYSEESVLLHQSLRRSGFDGPVIVIEDDGFLPEDVISVYQYFSGKFEGKPRYFNQINVPDFWEISASNSSGRVRDFTRDRGNIFYAEPKHKRLVRVVDWYDDRGTARAGDHYNRYGALYARTFFNKEGKRFCRTYFDAEGRETLLENYVTGDIILNRGGKVHIIKSKVDLVLKVLKEMDLLDARIMYNSLSTPFFVSEKIQNTEREDILFWQEGVRDDVPGNMQFILNGNSNRTKAIYVQKKESYNRFIELGVSGEMVKPLGFVYDFKGKNTFRNEALICTNSDQIARCEELINAFPKMHFSIAAITEMSSKLMSLGKYDNVSLYPNVHMDVIEELFTICDYYLDINHGDEILSAVKEAFLHDQLILAFRQTLHNKTYIAKEHVFEDFESMRKFLSSLIGNEQAIKKHLDLQKETAMAENRIAYEAVLK